MAQWAVVIPDEQWATERLFHHETVAADVPGGQPGDDVLLVAEESAVAVGRVSGPGEVTYVRRAFDEPVPADDLGLADPVTALEAEAFERIAKRLAAPPARKQWLVTVAMPIEAVNQADAVRQFWSYVAELGPSELPALVWPSGDELAMQAFVLGVEANQDPEEEDEE
jgi:hypothetical protein